jgi:hypothetical protein
MSFFLNYKDTNYWGPMYWNVLHNFADKVDNSNEIIKKKFLEIINNFRGIIPCDDCAQSYEYTLECAKYLLMINYLNKNYFKKLIYYLHLCVNIKKINDDSTNLDKFIEEMDETKRVENVYKNMFPNSNFYDIDVLLYLSSIDFQRFQDYFEKHMVHHEKVNLDVYILMVELFRVLYP